MIDHSRLGCLPRIGGWTKLNLKVFLNSKTQEAGNNDANVHCNRENARMNQSLVMKAWALVKGGVGFGGVPRFAVLMNRFQTNSKRWKYGPNQGNRAHEHRIPKGLPL